MDFFPEYKAAVSDEHCESFHPGISEYEMLRIAGGRINALVWEEFWPFSDLMEDPKKAPKNRQQQSPESTP
jgi:hypothetical protein